MVECFFRKARQQHYISCLKKKIWIFLRIEFILLWQWLFEECTTYGANNKKKKAGFCIQQMSDFRVGIDKLISSFPIKEISYSFDDSSFLMLYIYPSIEHDSAQV